ncbi:MAG: ferrous iron transport protein B [Odoribacter sp.]|nr:ferrous iron transport protein B [Odoribacter sp.]
MLLSELHTGQRAIVVKILGHGAFRKRVIEMGFVRGREVKVELSAPLKDPIKYEILGYNISLRRSEAEMIEVEPIAETLHMAETANHSKPVTGNHDVRGHERAHEATHTINVALVGNPNCGKTSLYNRLAGASEHVGNYSGVTVDVKKTTFHHGEYKITLIDLPGTYSLSSYTPEELYVRRYLREESPDLVLNVVDSSNLERNLYLTTELIDMNLPMAIGLNMYDELRASGAKLDYKMLGEMLGVPMVPIVARTGEGCPELLETIIKVYEGSHDAVRHIHVKLNNDFEQALRVINDLIKQSPNIGHRISPRYLAIKFLEEDREVDSILSETSDYGRLCDERDRLRASLERLRQEDISSAIAAEKYGFIAGALAETLEAGEGDGHDSSSVIDKIVTNKLFGFPLFLAVMFVMFWATFFLGQYPMDWIQSGVDALGILCKRVMPDGILKDLVCDGIIGGVGGVIVFLPNILILYFCISFMEDSGYMARAAFIMDKIMHRIGLHGKSFIPLLMGFGCNVPAIIATRAIESRSSRLITILINPFMSCSARLPIYVLFIGTFFYDYAAWVFMGLYLLGIAVAVITAKVIRKTAFKRDETPFVMELPPYRVPTVNAMVRHTWSKGAQYLRKMGGIILFASIVVWALNYFPRHDSQEVPAHADEISLSHDSYLEVAGKTISPVMEPLGFSWRASVAALAGVPAKEIVVSTLGVLYTDNEAVDDHTLGHRLETPQPVGGKPDFTPAVALSFLVFILLYCPCMATVTAIIKETGSWKWGAFSIIYNTVIAWVVAFIIYRIALIFI